jgi:chemotaxis protein MotB
MSCDTETAVPRKCPSGVPAWVLTFADLMSLLLSFFVLLFSFSEMDVNKYKQVAGSMAEAFGVQREIKVKDPPKGINIIATEFSAGVPQNKSVNRMEQITSDDFRQYLKIPKLRDDTNSQEKIDPNRVVAPSRPSAAFTDALEKEKDRLALALEKEIKEGYIEIEVKGRDIIIRIQERGTFASGSNLLIKPFRAVLEKMARTIGDSPGLVVVAGHTDSRPIHTDYFRSNWELSASRAVTVVHVLMQEGSIPPGRFLIEGYGDTRPIASNDTPQGRARNRRVEVSLHYDESLVNKLHAGGRGGASADNEQSRKTPK